VARKKNGVRSFPAQVKKHLTEIRLHVSALEQLIQLELREQSLQVKSFEERIEPAPEAKSRASQDPSRSHKGSLIKTRLTRAQGNKIRSHLERVRPENRGASMRRLAQKMGVTIGQVRSAAAWMNGRLKDRLG